MDILNQITEQRDALQKELEKAQARCQTLEEKVNVATNSGATGVRTRASGLLAAASASASAPTPAAAADSSATAADVAKYKMRSEKLTANLLACKQVEKELKSEVTKLRLELEMARSASGQSSSLSESSTAVSAKAPLQSSALQPHNVNLNSLPATASVTSVIKRKSLASIGNKLATAQTFNSEANKENSQY